MEWDDNCENVEASERERKSKLHKQWISFECFILTAMHLWSDWFEFQFRIVLILKKINANFELCRTIKIFRHNIRSATRDDWKQNEYEKVKEYTIAAIQYHLCIYGMREFQVRKSICQQLTVSTKLPSWVKVTEVHGARAKKVANTSPPIH